MSIGPGERELLKLARTDPDARLLTDRALLVVACALTVLAVAVALTLPWRT